MADDKAAKRLGRGLAALIGEMDKPQPEKGDTPVASDRSAPIELVERNPNNPRVQFAQDDIDDLARSMSEHGIIQPIVVRHIANRPGRFEIIAGERRWRAAQKAGLTDVPIIVRDVDDTAALELAIVENVQRSDLNPIEEAMGYDQLMREHGYSQADLGEVIGKSRSHVANTLRLLTLPAGVSTMVIDGTLSAGHARCLVTLESDHAMALADRIVRDGLSVRETERLAQAPERSSSSTTGRKREKDADTKALEKRLADVTGYRVDIRHKARGGELRIRYASLDQLDDLCRLLQRQ